LGSYALTVTVSDLLGITTSIRLTLSVNRPPLTVNVAQISTATVGSHFSTALVSSGIPPITWMGSGLPSWLTLRSNGILEGTPPVGANTGTVAPRLTRAAGTNYSFSVTATDATGNSGTSTIVLTVAPPPLLITTPASLPGATESKAYSTQLAASGGSPPYQWIALGLPSGFALSPAGVLSGTPPSGSAGSVSVSARVKDADGANQDGTFSLPVASAANTLIITSPAALPAAGTSVFYTATLLASGGQPPYTWSETAVGLGLTLSSSGLLSGTPGASGSYGFTGQVTDSAGATASQAFSLNVAPRFGITTPSPVADGIVGVRYLQIFGAIGGTQPYHWSLAGALPPGLSFTPDGIIAGIPAGSGTFSIALTVFDSAGNLVSAPFQMTILPPNPIDLILSAGSLAFRTVAGGTAPPVQSIGVNATGSSSANFGATVDVPWLVLTGNSGPTPGSITISADQSGLAVGFYQGRITLTAPGATAKIVTASLTVIAASASLTASPLEVRLFSGTGASTPLTSSVALSNTGSGSVSFHSNVIDLPFLSVLPQDGVLPPNGSAGVALTADTTALPAGFYRGRVEFTFAGGSVTVSVTVQVGASGRLILSSDGTTLDAQEGIGLAGASTQSFTVLGSGSSALNFSASVVGASPWIKLQTTAGVVSPTAPAVVNYAIDTSNLTSGSYYGRIRVSSPDASNSPLDFVVVLNLRAAGSAPSFNPFPAGLVFLPGGAAQTIRVFTDSGPALLFQVAVNTQGGPAWLNAVASQTTISTANPAQVTVSVNPAGLAPGLYRGFVNLAPGSSVVRAIAVTLVVPAGATSAPSEMAAAGAACAPANLVLTQTALAGNFATRAAWPRIVSIQLTDDCGTPVPTASVVTTFSNGDLPLSLVSSDPQNGVYSGNWAPSFAASPLTVTVTARANGLPPASSTVVGGVTPNQAPSIAPGGVLHLLNPKPNGLLAPGTIVEIFGSGLAATTVAPSYPPPTSVNGTSVLVSGIELPLYYVSSTQINAELPFELVPGREYQLLVNANNGYTAPQSIQSSALVPGVAAYADGHVIAQHSDFSLVNAASPAKPGEFLVIYLVGMGATDVPVATGAAAPTQPLANVSTEPIVRVGGQNAQVFFAGLTPQAVGLYQINFQVPQGIPSGDVALEVSQGTVSANKTLLPVAAVSNP
jgi:uncharacterized protein (TIGR03437 family)